MWCIIPFEFWATTSHRNNPPPKLWSDIVVHDSGEMTNGRSNIIHFPHIQQRSDGMSLPSFFSSHRLPKVALFKGRMKAIHVIDHRRRAYFGRRRQAYLVSTTDGGRWLLGHCCMPQTHGLSQNGATRGPQWVPQTRARLNEGVPIHTRPRTAQGGGSVAGLSGLGCHLDAGAYELGSLFSHRGH